MRSETTLPVHSAGTLVRLRSADTRHVRETPHTSKIGRLFDAGIKRHADRLQHRLFQPEYPGDRGILSGMTPRARLPAAGDKCRRPAPQSSQSVALAQTATHAGRQAGSGPAWFPIRPLVNGLEPMAPNGPIPT